MNDDIKSSLNACMFREQCRRVKEERDTLIAILKGWSLSPQDIVRESVRYKYISAEQAGLIWALLKQQEEVK